MFSSKINSILFWIIAVLSIGVAGYAVYGYLVLTPGTLFPMQLDTYAIYRVEIVLHALFASIALVVGLPQMNKKFREKFPKTNIYLRRVYYISVVIGAITGFLLAFHAKGGLVNTFGFGLLAIIWLYSCYKAFISVRTNKFTEFKIWIVRNYALTFAAVTLRIYLGIFFGTMGYLQFDSFYPTLGFLCWVPNLVITEWFILAKHNL